MSVTIIAKSEITKLIKSHPLLLSYSPADFLKRLYPPPPPLTQCFGNFIVPLSSERTGGEETMKGNIVLLSGRYCYVIIGNFTILENSIK